MAIKTSYTIEAQASSKSLNKSIAEIMLLFKGKRLISDGPLRKKMHEALCSLLQKETKFWYRRGFNRGHESSLKRSSQVPLTIAKRMRMRAPYFPKTGEGIVLHSRIVSKLIILVFMSTVKLLSAQSILLAPVMGPDNKYGFIDTTGSLVVKTIYDGANNYSEGLAAVFIGSTNRGGSPMNGYWGYIDKTGKVVIKVKFRNASYFSEGLAAVMDSNFNYGYIDKKGKWVIKPQYQYALPFSEGLAAVRKLGSGRYGFIDITGKLVLDSIYSDAKSFSEGLASVGLLGKVIYSYSYRNGVLADSEAHFNWPSRNIGYINKIGEIVIKPQYFQASSFRGGIASFSTGHNPADFMDPGSSGYINKEGVVKDEGNRFSATGQFSEGLAMAAKNDNPPSYPKGVGGWGYIDTTMKFVIPTNIQRASDFHDGLACVQINDSMGYIDRTGKVVFYFRAPSVGDFFNGRAVVFIGPRAVYGDGELGKYGYINKEGKLVIKPQYKKAFNFSNVDSTLSTESPEVTQVP